MRREIEKAPAWTSTPSSRPSATRPSRSCSPPSRRRSRQTQKFLDDANAELAETIARTAESRAEAERLETKVRTEIAKVRDKADEEARERVAAAHDQARKLIADAEERTRALVADAEDRLAQIKIERDAVAGYFESLRGVLTQAGAGGERTEVVRRRARRSEDPERVPRRTRRHPRGRRRPAHPVLDLEPLDDHHLHRRGTLPGPRPRSGDQLARAPGASALGGDPHRHRRRRPPWSRRSCSPSSRSSSTRSASSSRRSRASSPASTRRTGSKGSRSSSPRCRSTRSASRSPPRSPTSSPTPRS